MKVGLLVLLLGICTIPTIANAQIRGGKELEKKVFGWDKAMPPLGSATPAKASKNVNYSPARRKMIDLYSSWIRQTYTPIGRLPQPEWDIYPEKATSIEQIPIMIGSSMLMWVPTYDSSWKKITRAQPASYAAIGISANLVPGIVPASWFNTTSQFYFTMDLDREGKLVDPKYQEQFEPIVNEVRQKIGDYLIYVTGGSYINVVLIPGNKLPIEPVSIGEALNVAETGIKKANAKGDNPAERMRVQLDVVQKMRESYKDRLSDAAKIRDLQFRIYTFDTTYDVFQDRVVYPIYKFSPAVYAKCKTNQPQWITIQFPIPHDSSIAEKEIWKAMTERFNYQYVYDYYFNPQKVKGREYRPR